MDGHRRPTGSRVRLGTDSNSSARRDYCGSACFGRRIRRSQKRRCRRATDSHARRSCAANATSCRTRASTCAARSPMPGRNAPACRRGTRALRRSASRRHSIRVSRRRCGTWAARRTRHIGGRSGIPWEQASALLARVDAEAPAGVRCTAGAVCKIRISRRSPTKRDRYSRPRGGSSPCLAPTPARSPGQRARTRPARL